jgi:hypothetical protein
MTCSICKRSGSDVAEYKSTLSDKKLSYCLDCLYSGRESYEDLVNYGWEFNWFCKKYQQKIILPTLTFNHKTIDQFNDDVRNRLKDSVKE